MRSPRSLSSRASLGGFTLAEVVVATAVAALVGTAGMVGLLSAQKHAAATRTMTSARFIVQRNIETALGVDFTSASTPNILQITGSNGVPYNDLTSDGNGRVPIMVRPGTDPTTSGSNTIIDGVLTRIVTAHPNASNAVIRRVTFKIDYTYLGRPFSYSITTLRAQDDQ